MVGRVEEQGDPGAQQPPGSTDDSGLKRAQRLRAEERDDGIAVRRGEDAAEQLRRGLVDHLAVRLRGRAAEEVRREVRSHEVARAPALDEVAARRPAVERGRRREPRLGPLGEAVGLRPGHRLLAHAAALPHAASSRRRCRRAPARRRARAGWRPRARADVAPSGLGPRRTPPTPAPGARPGRWRCCSPCTSSRAPPPARATGRPRRIAGRCGSRRAARSWGGVGEVRDEGLRHGLAAARGRVRVVKPKTDTGRPSASTTGTRTRRCRRSPYAGEDAGGVLDVGLVVPRVHPDRVQLEELAALVLVGRVLRRVAVVEVGQHRRVAGDAPQEVLEASERLAADRVLVAGARLVRAVVGDRHVEQVAPYWRERRFDACCFPNRRYFA